MITIAYDSDQAETETMERIASRSGITKIEDMFSRGEQLRFLKNKGYDRTQRRVIIDPPHYFDRVREYGRSEGCSSYMEGFLKYWEQNGFSTQQAQEFWDLEQDRELTDEQIKEDGAEVAVFFIPVAIGTLTALGLAGYGSYRLIDYIF